MSRKKRTETEGNAPAAAAYANYFQANPSAEKLFVTSDEQVFLAQDWAKAHAKQLEDKTITTVEREEDEADGEEEAPTA
jgi:hypothetical protein